MAAVERQRALSAEPNLRIVEVFGPTIQGEGPNAGSAAHFLRLAGCNLACVWCDTAFSWDPARADPNRLPVDHAVEDVIRRLDPRASGRDPRMAAPAVRRLIITGGEPMLQTNALSGLCRRLRDLDWVLEVETSGSISPGPLAALVDCINVSPKLAHSGVAERARLRWHVLNEFAALPHATFKFVVRTVRELDEVAAILARLEPAVDARRVMVMAEGTDAFETLARSRDLVDAAATRGWGVTPRWHILLWGDQRGR